MTQWTWVWVNSRSWWWTGRPGVLGFMGSQSVRHNWATDLIWKVCPVLGGKWKVKVSQSLFVTPWTIQSMEFSRPDTGVGSLSLLQRIFPTQGSNPGLPYFRWILYQLSHKGSVLGEKGHSKALPPRLQPLRTHCFSPRMFAFEKLDVGVGQGWYLQVSVTEVTSCSKCIKSKQCKCVCWYYGDRSTGPGQNHIWIWPVGYCCWDLSQPQGKEQGNPS